ncbi:MAG TPA: DEAD/DEAH box helicase family protein, partial [Polyangia bacterium]
MAEPRTPAAERRATVTLLSNTRCSVSFSYPGWKARDAEKARRRILNLLDDALAIEQKGSQFNPAVQGGLWDGRRHVFHKNEEDGTFPAGVTRRVKALLREAGYKVMRTRDQRTRRHQDGVNSPHEGHADAVVELEISADMLAGVTLRDDQLRVIAAALENGCGLLHVATGGGKTEIAVAIMKALHDRRCLFIVHTKQLLHQARERIALRLGTIEEHIGVIGDGRFEPKHITVATMQSLTRVRGEAQKRVVAKYLKTIDLLFLDETHHASAKTFYRFVQRVDAPWRYGLSGTPFGLADGKGLLVEAAFGPVVERVTNEELIELGVNARPTIRMLEVAEPALDDGLSWQDVYKAGIVLNDARNAMIAREAGAFARKGWATLVLVRELWHGDKLAELLRAAKVPHAFVHGQMPTDEVERQKHRLVEGEIMVLIASPIFGEGVDIPAGEEFAGIRGLVIADGGQSVANVLQKIGRGLRR